MKKFHSKSRVFCQLYTCTQSLGGYVTRLYQRKNSCKSILPIMILMILNFNTYSQVFLPPYQPALGYPKGFVILKDSTRIEGSFRLINNSKNIKSCTLKDTNDQKYTFKTPQIDKVYISLGVFDKLCSYSDFTLSFSDIYQLNLKELMNPVYFIWENVNCGGKEKVIQLVNPGFDHRIKVFRDPNAIQEGGDQSNIGEDMSYYIVKAGTDVALKVKKRNYPEQFMQIFSDCPELIESLQGNSPDWEDFAAHVYIFDQFQK